MAAADQNTSALSFERPQGGAGHAVWSGGHGDVEIRFVGRGPGLEPGQARQADRAEVLARIVGVPSGVPSEESGEPAAPVPRVAWARQIHSADVLPAAAGDCGPGDALWTGESGLALAIATADCVPVLLAGPEGLAAVHAGWRGLAAGILPRAVETVAGALGADPSRWSAWIGPAIGACCYEVGEEVAEQVAAASAPGVVVAGPGESGKPHLDLAAAALWQLRAAGVGAVSRLAVCTRCDEERLWSYRRDGKGGGRNLAFVWRRP